MKKLRNPIARVLPHIKHKIIPDKREKTRAKIAYEEAQNELKQKDRVDTE